MEKKRSIVFHKDYFNKFYVKQNEKVRKKIAQVLVWIQTLEVLPVSIFKSIENVKGLYEIRIGMGGNIFRIFCCLDRGNLVVLFHGFQKKTQKTPPTEIAKAEKLMEEYFKMKEE